MIRIRTGDICFIYTSLWFIYFLQGPLYPPGSIISRIIFIILSAISLYYFVKVLLEYQKSSFIKAASVFLIMLILYGVISIILGTSYNINTYMKVSSFEYLKIGIISIMPIFSYYYFASKGIFNKNWINIIIILLLILTIVEYFYNQNQLILAALSKGSTREEFTSNIGYNFCALIPILFLWQGKRFFQYVLLCTCAIFIVICMKRGAILIGGIMILVFFHKNISFASGFKKLLSIILIIASITIASIYISSFIDSSDYFQQRINDTLEGNISGRDVLFKSLSNYLKHEASFVQLLVGSGASYTIKVAGNYAHNDWLELAVNNGLLGVVLYIVYFVSLLKDVKELHRKQYNYYATSLVLLLIFLFLRSIVSMSYGDIPLATIIALGICLGQLSLSTSTINNNSVQKRISDSV